MSNVRRTTSTLAQSSSMLRAPLPATSRPQSRLAAAQQQHTARLHCAGRATGADRCRQPSTVRAAVYGLLAVLLTLGKLGAAATALTAGQPAAIVAAAPARLRFVAPTSPRGEVTGPACANRTFCAVPRALMAATTRGGLDVSRSSPGPTGAYPGPASRGIQFLYPPTVNDHNGPLFTPRHGGTSPRPQPAPLLCRLRISPAHGSVTLTSLGMPTLTQPPTSTLCRRPGANRPRSEARYTAFGTRPRPRALGRAPPAPSPTKPLA
mgnify:CR=1 FL=1